MVNYDYTVRDSEGSVIQFRYGEDSIDVLRAPYLEKFDFFASNSKVLIGRLDPQVAMRTLDYLQHTAWATAQLKQRAKNPALAPETALNALGPAVFGATSDRYEDKLTQYLKSGQLPKNVDPTKFGVLMKVGL